MNDSEERCLPTSHAPLSGRDGAGLQYSLTTLGRYD